MRELLLATFAAILLIGGVATARANNLYFMSGNDLLDEGNNQAQRRMCTGYIMGVVDGMSGNDGRMSVWRMCLPQAATNIQAVDVGKRYLNEHPELRHLAASGLIAKALAEAFPCP